MRLPIQYFKACKNLQTGYRTLISIGCQSFMKYLKVPKAEFHLSSGLYVKSFQEKENEYAHSVLEKLAAYGNTIVKQPSETCHLTDSPKELQEFEIATNQSISQGIRLEDKSLSPIVSKVSRNIQFLSDPDLEKCLHLLCLWPPTPKTWTPHFKAIWNRLDYECTKRLPKWNVQHQLKIADYWFHLRLNRITLYNKAMIQDILRRLDTLTYSEIVQLMFYINLQRELSPNTLQQLEDRLLPIIKSVYMEELSVIGLAFFKTQNKIGDFSIVKAFIDRFVREVDTTQQVTIVALLKFLKKSMNIFYTDCYIPLFHKCALLVPHWEVKTCVHLTLLTSECHVYHPLLLNSVVDNVTKNIQSARLKDCTKLLQCLAHFNHSPHSSFMESLFLEYENSVRIEEMTKFPRDLIYAALYFAYLGHYNYNLLDKVLNPDFIENCTLLFPQSCLAFAEVDCCIEIECKDYSGHRLNKCDWNLLDRRKSNTQPAKPNALTRISNEVLESLGHILTNKESFHLKNVLPHLYLPDIIIQLSGDIRSLSSTQSLLLPPSNEIWVCLVLGVPFSFAYRSKQITGITAMKLRQLQKLGYETIFIPFYELPRDGMLRKKYLKQKLETVIEFHKPKLSHINFK